MGVMFIKEIKTFLDGSILWAELQDPETGETKRISGKELDEYRKATQRPEGPDTGSDICER